MRRHFDAAVAARIVGRRPKTAAGPCFTRAERAGKREKERARSKIPRRGGPSCLVVEKGGGGRRGRGRSQGKRREKERQRKKGGKREKEGERESPGP